MKKNILIYGLISGVIVSTTMLLSMNYLSHCEGSVDYGTSMMIGYASMLVAFSLLFVGIRNYRDKYNGGVITFGQAFKMGILMALIASTMYSVAWAIDYHFFMPDFMEKFSAHELEVLKAGGATQAEIEAHIKESAEFTVMYNKPVFTVLMTYIEILPVGLIVTLICAFILRRKPVSN